MPAEWKLTTEVNIFTASDAFQADPSICTPALKIVMDNGAHSPCHYGKQSESPGTGYNFVNWDSQQAHMDVTDDPVVFPTLRAALRPSLVIPPTITMYHVIFSSKPIGLDHPFTQVTKLNLKPPFPSNREAVHIKLSQIARNIGPQFVFGPAYEDGNKYIVICGQTSVDGFWDNTSSSNPELRDLVEELFTLADKDFNVHTALSSYAKTA